MKLTDNQRAEKAFDRWAMRQNLLYPEIIDVWMCAYLTGLKTGCRLAVKERKQVLTKRLRKK